MDEKFAQLKQDILSCRECRDLFQHEPCPIFQGGPMAKIAQISQAPSLKVQETQRPFNDVSGKKLKQEWYQIEDDVFYNPHCFYITSIGHCYPGKGKGSGDKLPPKRCADLWLAKELSLIQNEIYIIIGAQAANYLFPNQNFQDLIFKDQVLYGKPAYVLPHPSPLNRRWFKQYPAFEQERIVEIRRIIHNILELDEE
ncbi:MAG: uracil-DNA glycosylase family protein [Erysipelotrichaceae bacterium]|nr:uracil-DNA glycosylase family protein [Erysipelotrichaceae bacterium]